MTHNAHEAVEDVTTASLVSRFYDAVNAVQSNTLSTKRMVYEIYRARGLHKLLAERAIECDDTMAGDVALGAPHWLTYNDGTLDNLLNGAK